MARFFAHKKIELVVSIWQNKSLFRLRGYKSLELRLGEIYYIYKINRRKHIQSEYESVLIIDK